MSMGPGYYKVDEYEEKAHLGSSLTILQRFYVKVTDTNGKNVKMPVRFANLTKYLISTVEGVNIMSENVMRSSAGEIVRYPSNI